MLFNILKIKPIFGGFVIRYRFSTLFNTGLSIFRNRFWVHIQCRFDVLKYRAALVYNRRMYVDRRKCRHFQFISTSIDVEIY